MSARNSAFGSDAAMSGLGLEGGIYDSSRRGYMFGSEDYNLELEEEELGARDNVGLQDLESFVKREVRVHGYQAADLFIKGCPTTSWNGVNMREEQQKVFVIDDVYQAVNEQELAGFYAKFTSQVFTRLIMPTGCGKTTKVPWGIVKKTRKNVLLLVPSVGLVHYAKKGLKANKASVVLQRPVKPSVIIMTYADFVHCCAFKYHVMFSKLNLSAIVLDECHDFSAYAFVTRAILSTYMSNVSVVLMSATQYGINMQAQRASVPKIAIEPTEYENIFTDIRWQRKWAVDRTCVFMACDYDVYRLQEHLIELGYIVDILDSASTWKDVESIVDRYVLSSPTPRFVIAVPKFGTGYALPVQNVIDCGFKRVSQYDGEVMTEINIPLTDDEVLQHAGRAGRDIKGDCSCVVLTDKRLPSDTLIVPGDRILAWLLLKLCGIRPGKDVFPNSSKVFGTVPVVTRIVASYFDSSIPIPIYSKLLGTDGRVASEFVSSVKQWAYPGKFVIGSEDALPVGYDKWVYDTVGGYDGSEPKSQVKLKVPFKSVFSNKIVLHSIAAIQKGVLDLFSEQFVVDQLEDSDSDTDIKSYRGVTLRRLNASLPRVTSPEVVSVELPRIENGFSSDEMISDSSMKRRMTVLHKTKKLYTVQAVDGGTIVEIDEPTYIRLMSGYLLDLEFVKKLLALFDKEKMYIFVASEVFDKWGEAWCTFGTTLSNVSILAGLTSAERAKTSLFVSCLAGRFDRDVSIAMNVSMVEKVEFTNKRSFMSRLFSRDSPSDDVNNSLVWIEQSNSFVNRVAHVHTLLCEAVRAHEVSNVYSPNLNRWYSKDVPWGGGSVNKGHDGIIGYRKKKRRLLLGFR